MTREEAIHTIRNMISYGAEEVMSNEKEALRMAIESLSADTISRADAIDLVLMYFIPRSHTGERGEHEEDFVRTIFKSLPSTNIVTYEER